MTVEKSSLKKVRKMSDEVKDKTIVPRNVVKPPLSTAPPIMRIAYTVRSSFDPCACESTVGNSREV